jgi:antitoxin HigA-1
MNVPTNWVTQILKGGRAITKDTAQPPGHLISTNAEFWLNLQKTFEQRIAEQ